MPYSASVFSVMIASPSDVSEERNLIREIIHEWNDINAQAAKSVFLPVGWETHSAPDLSGRPQDIINKNVLKHCDFLIGVFWTRLGTPTGEFESGTVEEIKRHISEGKPAMVYFSTAPVAPESLDPDQYQSVKQFKEWCYSEGLVETYDNIQDFSEKFRRQFQIRIRDQINNSNSDFLSLEIRSLPDSDDAVENRLSEEAKRLLIEAAKDPSGTIMSIRFLSGQAIQTNGINFIESSDRRSAARWEAALDQTLEEGLVIARGYKNEVFEITSKGYDVVDRLLQAPT